MRMHHDSFVNIPLAVVWMASGYWLHLFESGSWFFGTLLPYIGAAVGGLQIYLLTRKLRRPN
jgi:hypothetical protein